MDRFTTAKFELLSYAARKNSAELSDGSKAIKSYIKKLSDKKDPEELRGIEGISSRRYFSCFPHLINQEIWHWQGRNRRPPKDGVNSLLSFGYTFLEKEIRIAIAGAGMDASIGFFHVNNNRKDSLVYDLMELFRANVIDKFVISQLNHGCFLPTDFIQHATRGCTLEDTARLRWLLKLEELMETEKSCFGHKCCREYIRKQVADFAYRLWDYAETV